MIKYEFKVNGVRCVRVSKALARKAYNYGLRVYFCPCKLRPGFPWNPEIAIAKQYSNSDSFETELNEFEFYNCDSNKVGRYASFYMEKWNMLHFQFSDGSNPYVFKSSLPENRVKELDKWKKGGWSLNCVKEENGIAEFVLKEG